MANKRPYPVRQSKYWMRAIRFAPLHRILKAVADFPNGLRAREINRLVQERDISLTRSGSPPAPTTLYHYRNTLLNLRALKRDGQILRVNHDDPDVYKLLHQPAPANGDQPLCDAAKDLFAALVLKNEQCRSFFFDLFMPSDTRSDSVSSFRQNGVPVKWSRPRSSHAKEIIFQNSTTGCTAWLTSHASVAAILYGVRYWARDELELIDEYSQRSDGSTIMFPVLQTGLSGKGIDSAVLQTIRFILSLRTPGEWTSFSVFDLIVCCCEGRRQPIRVLFSAIDWLIHEWPHHTVLIPTSRALATLSATSPLREDLELKRYYKASNGPYISHIRIHRDITLKPGSSQIIMSDILQKLRLDSNPFEPSATGMPLSGELSPPNELAKKTIDLLDIHQTGQGVKAIVIVGEYGTGKTCLLQWLHREIFPSRQIKSFYFDNPGVQFYDLANMLLRTIGRKDFAKFIWELASSHVSDSYQGSLFQKGYEEYLSSSSRSSRQKDMTSPLREAIINSDVTTDEQIAHCLARIVTEIVKKPYFEYRDFIPRQQGSVVAEKVEAPYFSAILKTIAQGTGAKAISFLIDEFEEIGLQKRLTKRESHDYLATLKRLINLAQGQQVDFWIILSMTPDAYDTTRKLEPALDGRFSGQSGQEQVLSIEPLDRDDAFNLMQSRIKDARSKEMDESTGSLFPFPEDIVFRPNTYSNPRRLVKTCFRAIAQADADVQLPFTEDYLHRIEDELYPSSTTSGNAQI